jgi:hypothetical protein
LPALEAAMADEPKHIQARKAAQTALDDATAAEQKAAKDLLAAVEPFLASDKLDAKLVKCAVLSDATPKALAEFAQQGKERESMVEKLLADCSGS